MKNLKDLSNEDLLTLFNNINSYIKTLEATKKEVAETEKPDDK